MIPDLPIVFINFKTYAEATGENAVSLARKAEEAASEGNASIALVVQAVDIRLVSKSTSLPVFAQHLDPIGYGSNTGHVLPEALKNAGAVGCVLNHAENKRDNGFIERAIVRARELGLAVMVCAENIGRAKEIASFGTKPDLIAVEPPELIGGDISVSTAQPELITDSVKAVKEIAPGIEVITGAGIKNTADVRAALSLGTKGVFVASGVIKSGNHKEAISELVRGLE